MEGQGHREREEREDGDYIPPLISEEDTDEELEQEEGEREAKRRKTGRKGDWSRGGKTIKLKGNEQDPRKAIGEEGIIMILEWVKDWKTRNPGRRVSKKVREELVKLLREEKRWVLTENEVNW